jgi:hypothetical protein
VKSTHSQVRSAVAEGRRARAVRAGIAPRWPQPQCCWPQCCRPQRAQHRCGEAEKLKGLCG